MHKQAGSPRPWYKERWPWLLMAGPIAAVIAGIVTFQIAATGADDMVVDDYYKQGKDINLQLTRDKTAAAMGLSAQAMFSDDGSSVRVLIQSKQPLNGQVQLALLHPTRKDGDQLITLTRQGDNFYQGRLASSQAKHWYLRLQDSAGKWRLQGEWRPAESNAVTLGNPKLEPVQP